MTQFSTQSRGRASPSVVRKGRILAAGVLALALGAFAQGTTIYVDIGAPPNGNGGSWATAYQHLNDALDEASTLPGPVEVLVAEGVYKPNLRYGQPVTYDRASTFAVPAGIVLRGGYLGSGLTRDPALYVTTLTGDLKDTLSNYGDNSYHVVTIVGSSPETVIDGFTIVGGNAIDAPWPGGGGIYVEDWGGITITECNIERNLAANGGGFWAGEVDALIIDSTFVDNAALYGGAVDSGWGGGNAHFVFIGVSFEGNTAFNRGGAYYAAYEIQSELINCRFRGNEADEGGAIYNYYNLPMDLTNCDFAGNTAFWRGGALSSSDTNMDIVNVTVAGNYAFSEGGGFYLGDDTYSDTVEIKNSIFYHNDANVGSQIALGPGWEYGSDGLLILVLDAIDLQDNCAGISVPADWGGSVTHTAVFDADPLFVSVGSTPSGWGTADLKLQDTSPCINAAKSWLVADQDVYDLDGDGIILEPTPIDLIGERRIVAEIDHGAYETQTCHWDLSGDWYVGMDELTIVLAKYGTSAWPEDLNEDGSVNFPDLTGVLSHWGPCP